jgi:ABC-type arginine transport system permease subunit
MILFLLMLPVISFAATMQFFCAETLDNAWCTWVMANYSTVIEAIPILVVSILKLIAIFNPAITSNSLVDQVQAWFKKEVPAPSPPLPPAS